MRLMGLMWTRGQGDMGTGRIDGIDEMDGLDVVKEKRGQGDMEKWGRGEGLMGWMGLIDTGGQGEWDTRRILKRQLIFFITKPRITKPDFSFRYFCSGFYFLHSVSILIFLFCAYV